MNSQARNESRKSEGQAEQVGGRIRRFFGRLLGNRRMAAEGRVQELRGRGRENDARASEQVHGKIEEVGGAIKNRVGAAIGDERTQVEGRARELHGQERQDANR